MISADALTNRCFMSKMLFKLSVRMTAAVNMFRACVVMKENQQFIMSLLLTRVVMI